jgi:hypothetical protein
VKRVIILSKALFLSFSHKEIYEGTEGGGKWGKDGGGADTTMGRKKDVLM